MMCVYLCVQADEAEATYKTCIADATAQQLELEHTKVTVLRQLQDVVKQSDQTLRSVRTNAPTHRLDFDKTISQISAWVMRKRDKK